jgi:hypothetical protein
MTVEVAMGAIGAVFLTLDLGIHAPNVVQGRQESFAIWLTMVAGAVASIAIVWLAWRYPNEGHQGGAG